MTSVEQLARTSLDEFNRGDLEAMLDDLAPDYVYDETGTGRHITDTHEFMAALRGWKTALPDVAGTVERAVVDGDTIALEVVWRGTHTGTLATPTGDIPATGRSIEVYATLWMVWRDDKCVSQRHHLDVLGLLAQIGAIPVPA